MRYRPFLIVGLFLYLWLMVGFFTGTLTLLGPVRWLTAWGRTRGWSQGAEDVLVGGLILVFVAASVVIARMLVRLTLRTRHRSLAVAIPVLVTLLSAGALWGWMNPGVMDRAADQPLETLRTRSGAQFVFGPYPDRERLEELKRTGFTGVVTLLHPAVVPFEPKILHDERQNAEEVGLRLVQAPMLPWVGSNEGSLALVRRLASDGEGRYYVHCYLGRDRVNVVKRVLAEQGVEVEGATDLQDARGFDERDEPFERGPLFEMAEDLWLVPFPNEHEFFGYLLFGNVRHVVLALDGTDPRQRAWLDEASRLLTQYAVEHSVQPLVPGDTAAARSLAERVQRLPRPLALVVPFTESEDGGDPRIARMLMEALRAPEPSVRPPAAAVARRVVAHS